jgi:hypothetical protein
MHRLDGVGDLHQLARGGFRIGEGAGIDEFHDLQLATLCSHLRRPAITHDVGASQAADLGYESRLDIRQPQVIRPLVGLLRRDLHHVAALVVAAVDQQPAGAGCPHFAECDLLGPLHPA